MKHQSPEDRKRNPLDSLSSFVNSFELKAMGSKLTHSASSLGRSVSHRFADLPLFAEPLDSESDHDTTLNDDDWLASPSQKQKHRPSMSNVLSPQSLKQNLHNSDFQSNSEVQSDFQSDSSYQNLFQSNEHLPNTAISTFTVPQDSIPRIDEEEMVKILRGDHADQFDQFVVVDCRFPYEYEGGHIPDAVNISSQQDLEERFIANSPQGKCLLVFHCEYSLLRGPTMACHLRKVDRLYNAERYPQLSYPDIVVLEGGYKGFYDKFKHLCVPQAYVEMKDSNHKRTCQIEMNKVLQASKLTRAKSYSLLQPRSLAPHTRSASLTALLTTSEIKKDKNDFKKDKKPDAPPSLRKRRSLKVQKRDRKDRFQSIFIPPNPPSYPAESPTSSPSYLHFDEDFAPPCALFRNHSTSSSASITSSQSSLYSDSLAVSYSSDSLSESVSPFNDADFAESSPERVSGSSSLRATSPNLRATPKTKLKPRPIARPPMKMSVSSPTVSSPLTSFHGFDSAKSTASSGSIDGINTTPVEFPAFRHFSRSGSSIGGLDLGELSEE